MRPLLRHLLSMAACICAATLATAAEPLKITFTDDAPEHRVPLKDLGANLPTDWTDYKFLVVEWRATSSERFQLELFANDGEQGGGGKEVMVGKRIGPFQNARVRAAIPLDFFRKPAREGFDLAATYNKHRDSYWININFGGSGPCKNVTALGFQMTGPIPINGQPPELQIYSVKLAKEDPGDAVLDPKTVVDPFGQWITTDWPGKANSLDDLKKAWAAEDTALTPDAAAKYEYDKYGGYKPDVVMPEKGNGFFRAQLVTRGGRGGGPPGSVMYAWWFIDPDGGLFYSTGVNGIGTASATPSAGRTEIFAALPPGGGNGSGTARGAAAPGGNLSFYTWNLHQRFGPDFNAPWGDLTFRRLDAWGFNTVAGFSGAPNAAITRNGAKKPYTAMLRNWSPQNIMGMPDVYSPDFPARADRNAQTQCTPLKDDPYLLGYFVGNEPPWPNRESLLCDAILADTNSTPMKTALQASLKAGDTPERRKQFVYDTFDKYLAIITAAVKKADPNHLTLGIRLGGEVPDEVIKACRVFDVCSINVYDFAIDPKFLDRVAALTGRPIIVGEFHFGSPGRGMGGGLRQVASQKDRGLAYSYYVEHAAAHPNVIGTHWFQWIDQPSTGRNDGENYNIGFLDVTDRPYTDMLDAVIQTHQRLLAVHSGQTPPTTVMPAGRSTAEIK